MPILSLSLAGFILLATGLALRFGQVSLGQKRLVAADPFFQHLGMVDGVWLIAGLDGQEKQT